MLKFAVKSFGILVGDLFRRDVATVEVWKLNLSYYNCRPYYERMCLFNSIPGK